MRGSGARRVGLIGLVVSLVHLHAPPGHAQTAAADGIDAFVRGDYPRAAEILKPIAERWPGDVDDTAVFFMAALYANGLGVPRDVVRACALSLRAAGLGSGPGTGPFAHLNSTMSLALRSMLTPAQEADCHLLAFVGFEHRFEPVTFSLDTGHWIAIELSNQTHTVSATVGYQGKEKQTTVAIGLLPGVVFLPVEHTALEVGGAVPGRRHFIELLTWLPEPAQSAWQLHWSLSEVVREDLVPIAGEDILTVPDSGPPGRSPVDLRRLVALRVNDVGEAEWAILARPDARSETVETDRERQEVRAQREARQAADARVDWTRVRDPNQPPSFVYADADGCSHLLVYGWSADRTEAMAVRADATALGLTTASRTFDLAVQGNDIEVSVDLFERPQRAWPFCTDAGGIRDGSRRDTWKAVSGTATFQLSPPGVRAYEPRLYRATLQVDDAEFVSPTGLRLRLSRPIRLTAIVGSCPGGCVVSR